MRSFTYTQLPGRVVFGVGALDHLPREIELLGATRALVLSTPEQEVQAEDVAKRLGARCAGMFPRAVMHVPIDVARAARDEAKRLGADCAVAIGGGEQRVGLVILGADVPCGAGFDLRANPVSLVDVELPKP